MTPTKKKLFVLESQSFLDCLDTPLSESIDEIRGEATVVTALQERTTIPKGYDLYCIHTSLVSKQGLRRLIETERGACIILRDSIMPIDDNLKGVPRYGDGKNFGYPEFYRALEKLGVLRV